MTTRPLTQATGRSRQESAEPIAVVGPASRDVPSRTDAMHGKAPHSNTSDGFGWLSPHLLAGLASFASIVFGALMVDELDLSPASSFGYGLGIFGLAMMGVLLAYSLRKRVVALRHVGSLRNWFELHLVLGMSAPAVILYHANFRVESANAAISLACLLIVAGSGVGGRFLYGRLYRSLAGERRTIDSFQRAAHRALEPIEHLLERAHCVRQEIDRFEAASAGLTGGLLRSLPALVLRLRARGMRRSAKRSLHAAGVTGRDLKTSDAAIAACMTQLCRAGELRLFAQLFALWHAVHVPLTVILFLSAFIHVVAVHLY